MERRPFVLADLYDSWLYRLVWIAVFALPVLLVLLPWIVAVVIAVINSFSRRD